MIDILIGTVAMFVLLISLGAIKAYRDAHPGKDEQIAEGIVIVKKKR